MAYLPLANILHYKLRSALSSLGIGIGICMLITLSGLSRGSLSEVADRWEAIDADLIVCPANLGDSITTLTGIGVSDRYAEKLTGDPNLANLVRQAVPVFLWQVSLAGQNHLAAGVDAANWPALVGGRTLLPGGRLFDPDGDFGRFIDRQMSQRNDDEAAGGSMDDLVRGHPHALEIVVDSRLARTGHFSVGQTVEFADHPWRIVGIVPEGGMTRVYMPRRTAQALFAGSTLRSTMVFLKLQPGIDPDRAARELRGRLRAVEIIQVKQYRDMLVHKFGAMFVYVDAVNVIALLIAFLFIMITLYTMVLQRTREIAILKSSGASSAFILRQVLAESMILTGAGLVVGVALSFVAAWVIQALKPLLTVTITWEWLLIAVAAALGGAVISGLYPAWRATRVDMVEALTLE
jgi:ABC-type lipoprotein release transport system permease subunit